MAFLSQLQAERTDVVDLGGERSLRLVRLVGKGASSSVYLADLVAKHGLRRPVALKVLAAVSSDESEQVFAALVETARRAACIAHPNVVQTFEALEWRKRPCLVTELVDGISLAALEAVFASTERRMPLDLALFIATEAAEGLAAARVARGPDGFQLGLVHHGLSSREVLLSWRGEVKVGDFEMQNVRAASSSIRSSRAMATRAVTMAPELARGIGSDARSDVFSFGVMLHELLVGPRFPASLGAHDALRLARDGYIEPQTFKRNLPEPLVAVMNRCLALDPEQRYPNAVALAYELRRVVLGLGVGDGRYFLRTTLERETGERDESPTAEVSAVPYEAPVVPISPRRRRK